MKRIVEDGNGFHDFKKEAQVTSFHHDFANYVKSFGDIYFWPKGNFHVVTKATLAKAALKNPAISCDRSSFFISRMPNMDLSLIGDFFEVVSRMMVMRDGEDHRKRRSIATFGLNDELIDHYAEKIPFFLDQFINEAKTNDLGEIDFAQDIAARLPSVILAELFCIPEEDRKKFSDWSNTMTGFFGGGSSYENEDGIRVNKAAQSLREYFKELLTKRRESPENDFFSGMLKVANKFDFDEADLISQAIMMLVAGQVTTTDQINNIMFQLLHDQKTLKEVQDNSKLILLMIEEFKRLDPAVTFIFRVALADTAIGDQIVKKGETIFISTHCINRDEEIFQNPHLPILSRKTFNHFSYGHGAHYCLGARLGRIEMNKLFSYFVEKFPNIRLGQTPSVRDHYSLSFSGFKSLPVVLE